MKKGTCQLLFASILSVWVFVFITGVIISPASGVPGTGTSITVKNKVNGAVPSSVWSYTITEISPPKNSNPYKASFTLPAAGGGSFSFGGLRSGAYEVAEASKFGYYAIMTITSNKYGGSQEVSGWEVVINLASSEGKTVTFTNSAMPAFAMTGLIVPPPSDLGVSLPPLKPIPVQASLNVDINNDGRLDLVLGKPTVILVNLAGPSFLSDSQITVSVMFEGKVYNRVAAASSLTSGDTVVSFYSADNPIVPSSAGNEQITGIYQVNGGTPVALYTTDVTVKGTAGLSLYYAGLTKSNYGTESQAAFSEMAGNSCDFIDATYPVKSVTANATYKNIAGNKPGTARDPYAGMLKDIQAVAQRAQLYMGGSAVGVAIAPMVSGLPDYFTYHGFPGAAGVSFGPAVKGVIALDGYWTVPAHEVAHTFGLYYGVPEEYQLSGAPFPANGVNARAGTWITGYNFMSIAQYKTTSPTWVNTSSTYEYLFNKTRVIPNDPNILLVNGIIYKNGTVEFPLDWVHMQQGTPDTLTPGNYSLTFVASDGTILGQISFGLSFSVQIDNANEGGVTVETHQAGFSFAVPYPPTGTTMIQVVNSLTGTILATYDMANVKTLSSMASLDGTEGLNGWYVSSVDVTITAMADPAVGGVKEIHYILDGTETVVPGGTVEFTISADGTYSLEYWGVDNAGNIGAHHTQTVKIDKTAPQTTKTLAGTKGTYPWWISNVDVSLSASDGTSGVKEIHYKLDGVETTVSGSSASFTITADGTHTLEHWAIDNAGNEETHSTQTINIDKTPPTITGAATTSPNANGWYNTDVTVHFTASDSLSGIDTVTPDTTLTGEGAAQHVLGTAVDKAGNTATFDVTGINIDKTPPTISITIPDGTEYYLGQPVTPGWSADDSLSGVASVTGAIDTSTVGTKTLIVTAIDNAGNIATATRTYHVHYVFSGFLSPIPNSVYEQGRTVPVKFQLTDYQGNFVTWATAEIHVRDSNGAVISGEFCYNSATNTYQFNLDTKPLAVGQLEITAMLDDGTSYTVVIYLR